MKNVLSQIVNVRPGLTRAVFAATAVAAAIVFSVAAEANNVRWFLSPSDPYVQDWSDTVSISADDNWDNFIAVTGYRGDGLTSSEGVNPQSVIADGSSTPLDVIANQSNPNTLIEGGVAEFDGIPNPTVALKGSSTASAPHLIIQLNHKSCPDSKFISVNYKVRDLDSTSNNAVQSVALQYRVGHTGSYINVGGAFVADATEPNTATKVTNVIGMLPHIPVELEIVYLRIITTNAAGNDEWVGIDDINIGCFAPTAAEVEVTGRVLTPYGNPVGRATVSMTDASGITMTTRTNSFGYYRFSGLPVGYTYTLSAEAKGMRFTPQLIALTDSVTDLDIFGSSGEAGVTLKQMRR